MIVSSAISTARAFGHILVHSLHQVPRPGGSARSTAVNLTRHCADAGSSFVLMRNSLSGKSTRTPCRPGVTPSTPGSHCAPFTRSVTWSLPAEGVVCEQPIGFILFLSQPAHPQSAEKVISDQVRARRLGERLRGSARRCPG